ncbi:hypothetical protein HG536_0H04280 [Torulaspora globosa]|uniref:Uncharacterized protein n=1 Tax=Torulaspora globosa TaxID=48254 RepID=A0A7G3ZNG6_9SACH|nr:uncharacterized protein HG536_0H04280 [Torulaspora globosa]QLL35052.1 hypothetical protein HG536_0H04280 [Torulaspora globosa]
MPRTRVSSDCGLLKYLLRNGLRVDDRDSWKYLALLMEVCYGVPKAKQAVVKLMRSTFAGEVGHLLDNIRDFQQANFIVELLSNCFPRKSTHEVGVVMPPILWREGRQNDSFFNSTLYPFRGRHGDAQVINFLLDVFQPRMRDVMLVGSVTYHSSGASGNEKLLRSGRANGNSKHFYLQASHDCIYLWDGNGMFLEINRRLIKISMTGIRSVKIAVVGKPLNCFRSANETWLQQFSRAEWLLLDADDQSSYEEFCKTIGSVKKVSEVQTYLVLNHTDEDHSDRVDCTVGEGAQLPDYSSNHEPLRSDSSRAERDSRPAKKDQLVTPEQSDARICSDEWDFKPSSEEQAANSSAMQVAKRNTPSGGDDLDDVDLPGDDGSPLVLAQKRKKIREATKTLEILKNDFALVSNPPSSKADDCKILQRSPSLLITKYQTKKGSLKDPMEGNSKVTDPSGNVTKSIAPRDLNILDSIFRKPELSTRKKVKGQRTLKNYRPVIEVPSQNVPTLKTRNQKKKVYADCSKDAAVTTPDSRRSKKQTKNNEAASVDSNLSVDKAQSAVATKRPSEGITGEVKSTKKSKPRGSRASNAQFDDGMANIEKIDNPTLDNTDIMDSTTILGNISYATPLPVPTGNVFTDRLQEQIFSSISHFSNEMVRKMTIINNELNNTIVKELSGKYQKLFQQLQKSFQEDTEEMLQFVAEIKDMMKLPENELLIQIKSRKSKAVNLRTEPSAK